MVDISAFIKMISLKIGPNFQCTYRYKGIVKVTTIYLDGLQAGSIEAVVAVFNLCQAPYFLIN